MCVPWTAFDDALAQYFAEKFEAAHGLKPLEDLRFYQDFRDRAEKAKIDLSDAEETFVNLSAGGKFLDLELQRSEFERLNTHYIDQTQFLTEQALNDAGLAWKQVDKVLLVGGSTRMPKEQRMVRELTGSVSIEIVQREDDDPEACAKVGDAGVLTGIPPQPRGIPHIEVTLAYDKSGIVHLHAQDKGTGKALRARIEYTALMSRAAV